jgi:apolipoprotein N-acyltransferase
MNLLAAAILLVFSSGRWVIPLAAWLSPIVLLRFTRGGRAAPRLAAAAGVLYAVGCWTWWGMVPVPAPGYFGIMVAIMAPMALPYVVDRLVGSRHDGFGATLVFPSAWVATEYLISRVSPYGSWGLVAYTQADNLPLIQSAAVTGLWGIGFLIAWTASVANWAWARAFAWSRVRAGVLGWGATLAAVLLLGGARLVLPPPAPPNLRVASLTVTPSQRLSPWDLISRVRSGAGIDSLRADLHAHEQALFEAVRREARAGARLVAWSEVNALVLKDEETAFQQRVASVARAAGVHLIVGVAVFSPGQGFYENQLMAFDSTGATLAQYHKARPVPSDPERGADHGIPVFDTALGRIAGAVCFDADFPDLIRRAGQQGADLLVIPASDWRAIDPTHTRMALFRGIENGCSVVRQTNKGLSAAADFRGRILATSDYFLSTPHVMVAQVPARGVRTPYARIPDLLPLLCIGVIAAFGTGAVVRGRRT